ncbi:hypothetical protein RRG08_030367 [Elysia crispata]|uniref:G-protein coupled receptors family 1 profile domain-containing protein n=1 Tax=Elysia crispata TaxID=231223 RepID=A0AAE0YGJ5_9GAST|nr:hypothetical protein RRG08_030367 [Elysia crispata]
MNVSASLDSVPSPPGASLISDHIADYIMVMLCFMILTFSLPSIVLNIVNVYVFLNTKLDSVTVCFISLALSDLSAMLLLSTNAFFSIIVAFGLGRGTNLPTYTYALSFGFSFSVDSSSASTTYIALQRGLCVAFPFLTRHVFNKNRSLVICVSIFLVMLSFSLPRFTAFKLKTISDPMDNTSTIVVVEYLDSWDALESFYTMFVKTALVFIEYGVMIICTVAITIGMRSSIKLKQNSTALTDQPKARKRPEGKRTKKDKNCKDSTGNGEDQLRKKRDCREALVVKQSLVVVLTHVILTTPRIFACLYQVFEPRYRLGGQFQNLFFVFFTAINVTDSINAFVNFFVYLKFNSKFRNYFLTSIYKQKAIV